MNFAIHSKILLANGKRENTLSLWIFSLLTAINNAMASQEADKAELGTASAGSPVEPELENNSVYQSTEISQNYQKDQLQALGVSQPYFKKLAYDGKENLHVENFIYALEELLSYDTF